MRLNCVLATLSLETVGEFGWYTPERILIDHGTGIFENASSALAVAYRSTKTLSDGSSSHGKAQLHALVAALRE